MTTFDQDLFNDGLLLSVAGMGIVFAVLALLALSIKVLSFFDRDTADEGKATGGASAPSGDALSPASLPDDKITGQQVAAIAVALALSEPKATFISPSTGSFGGSSGLSTGAWLQSGRMRSLGTTPNIRGIRG